MKLKSLILLFTAGAVLSGCFPGQADYTKSEKLKAAYHNLVPSNTGEEVFWVGVCVNSADEWRTAIEFDDGARYLYKLAEDNSTVTLESVSTKALRQNGGSYDYSNQYECYDRSVYRFIYALGLRAEVATPAMVRGEFGAQEKARVGGAAMAVSAAMKAHASFVPKESTW